MYFPADRGKERKRERERGGEGEGRGDGGAGRVDEVRGGKEREKREIGRRVTELTA